MDHRAYAALLGQHDALGGLGGPPPVPDWYTRAMAREPERSSFAVAGADIELLTWGELGRPGLLLLHGNRAQADWWRCIAPFFARDLRVAAISWSGMGRSAWRERYSVDLFVQEMLAALDAGGLREHAARPLVVAHSFAGFPSLACAADHGASLAGLVVADTPLMSPEMRARRMAERRHQFPTAQATRIYESRERAVQRFRLLPEQACENRFIVDDIARASLREVSFDASPPTSGPEAGPDAGPAAELETGWTWRFDPFQWKDYTMRNAGQDLRHARCPVAYVWGADSALVDAEVLDFVREMAPSGSPMIEVPEAAHHLMLDQPLAFVGALKGLFAAWPRATVG